MRGDGRRAAPLAVVATGGYGRGMLAPFSDIDLLFITPEPAPAETLAAVEFSLYLLWDLGLKVGHATRTVAECIAEAERDVTVRTSMIDARLLAGDQALFTAFAVRFAAACAVARRTSSPPSRPSATCATTASARARSWSSRTSRRAAAACATCRPCTGWRATCSTRG